MKDGRRSGGEGQEPARLWELILRVTEDSDDEAIQSLRVSLFLELNQKEAQPSKGNVWQMAATLWSFRPTRRRVRIPRITKDLPMMLFRSSTGSHMLNMLPVVREAKRRGLLGGLVAASMNMDQLREFDGVMDEESLLSLTGWTRLPQILRDVRRSFDHLVELFRACDVECALRIKRNYGRVIRQMVLSKRMASAFSQLLSVWRPSCVISTSDDWPFEFQLYCQAKRMGIPNAVIQHGELNGAASWPIYGDIFLVWGDIFRQKLLGLGAPSHRLNVCGMPASDDLFLRYQGVTAKEINKAAPVCLIFSHTQDRWEEPELFDAFDKYLTALIRATPRFQWKIKLHPAEDDSYYQECGFNNHPRVSVLPKNVSLEEAVEQADVVCTIRSTAGLQAMMMQRPLIIIDLVPNLDCSVWWPIQGGGLAAKTPEEFKKHLDRLIDHEHFRASVLTSQSEFLDKSFANKGRAAVAIVDYLEQKTREAAEAAAERAELPRSNPVLECSITENAW